MKRIAQRAVALTMTALLTTNSVAGAAQTITYSPSTGTLHYESTDTAPRDSSLFAGMFNSLSGALEKAAQKGHVQGDPLSVTLNGLNDAGDPSQNEVKIFHLDAATLEPLGDPVFEGTLDDITLNRVELKGIQDVRAYREVNGTVTQVREIDPAHPEAYVVRLEMKEQPVTYAPVAAYDAATREITLGLPNTVTRAADGKLMDRAVVKLEVFTLETLLREMEANPSGRHVLTADLDGSMFQPEKTPGGAFKPAFTGTLDGNGHTIKNLKVPLFTNVTGATIQNLTLENVDIQVGKGQGDRVNNGALAMIMTGGSVKNVHVKGASIRPNNSTTRERPVGGLVGRANGTAVSSCSVTGLNLTINGSECGGLVGRMRGGSITDCYTQGAIGNVSSNNGYTRVGGLLGFAEANPEGLTVTVRNSIANTVINTGNLTVSPGTGPAVAGLVGDSSGIAESGSQNNLVLGGVNSAGYRFANAVHQKKYANCFELDTAPGTAGTEAGIVAVTQTQLTSGNFFGETMKLSSTIWDLEAMESTGVPALRGAAPGGAVRARMMRADDGLATLYANLSRLMPFTTEEQIMALGKGTDVNHLLNQKTIVGLLPLAGDKYLSGMTRENFGKVDGLLVSFTDGTQTVFSLSRPKLTDYGAPSYAINGLGVYYVGNFYVADTSAAVYADLAQAVSQTAYERDLLPLVGGRETMNYKRYGVTIPSDYNMLDETAAKVLGEGEAFAAKLLSSRAAGCNANVKSAILQEVVRQNVMPELGSYLYAYIYYRTWYNLDFERAYLPEVLFFRSDFYSPELSLGVSSNAVTAANRTQRRSDQTATLYQDRLSAYTKRSTVGEFIDYNILTFTDSKVPADWFAQHFKGEIIEGALTGLDVDVRVYNKLKRDLYRQMLLPAISLDNTDLYFLSVPSQLFYGSMAVYLGNPNDPAQRENFRRTAEGMKNILLRYYQNSVLMIPNGAALLSKSNKIGVDTFYESGKPWVVPPESTSPAKKYFSQAVKTNIDLDSKPDRAGYSNGTTFFIVNGDLLNMFGLFSHENTHSQDGEYFLGGFGRRSGEAEMYTEGVFSQPPSGNDTGITFISDDGPGADKLSPLKAESINSNEKSQRYYERFYEAMYTIDMMEVEAMLSLPSEVQRQLVFQYNLDPDNNNARVVWNQLATVRDYEALNLKTYADFSKHYLNITRDEEAGAKIGATQKYESPSFMGAALSTPYNVKGTPDWRTYKRFGNELMAIKGYGGGYIPWMSNQLVSIGQNNDLGILRYVTGDAAITYERFDAEKHDKILAKYKQNGSDYFDWDACVQWFRNAYLLDVAGGKQTINRKPNSGAVKDALLRQFSRTTGDYAASIYAPRAVIEVSTAKELAEALQNNAMQVVRLAADIDFAGYEYTGDSVVTGTYVGGLDGNGHSIKNLQRPLLNQLQHATVENLRFEDAQINLNGDNVGVLARGAHKSRFANVHVAQGCSVAANSRVGGLLGTDRNGLFAEVSVNAAVTARGSSAGGIAATLHQSSLANCYTAGSLAVSGGYGGGLAGEITRSTISQCYSASTMSLRGAAVGGSLIGLCKRETSTTDLGAVTIHDNRVRNSIALGGGINVRKVDGGTSKEIILDTYQNCFELRKALGTGVSATLDSGAFTAIIEATDAQIGSIAFYRDTLSFDGQTWNLADVENGAAPRLHSPLDTNIPVPQITLKIGTLDELLSIAHNPDITYMLTADIDASAYTGDTPLIPAFGGRLMGMGFAVKNLKQPLFEKLSGTVERLTLQNAAITDADGQDVGALAKTAEGASVLNLTLNDAQVTGGSRVGGVFGSAVNTSVTEITANGVTVTGSEYVGGLLGSASGVTITQAVADTMAVSGKTRVGGLLGSVSGTNASLVRAANITVTGQSDGSNLGGLIGYMEANSALTNAYVSGTMSVYGSNNGGVVGSAIRSGCTAVFARVDVSRMDAKNGATGGFAGYLSYGTMKNCVAVGNMSGTPLPKKFSGGSENGTDNQNSYQYELATGTANGGAVKTATEADLKNPAFYVESLLWSDETWDFSKVAEGADPALRFVDAPDPEPEPEPEAKYQISTLADFMSMRYDMAGSYTLKNDLDLRGIQSSAVLIGTFTGTFDGKGFAIIGADCPLFERIEGGAVSNLAMTGITAAPAGGNNGLLAKTAQNGVFENIHINKSSLKGQENTGGLIGADNGSTITACSVNMGLTVRGSNAGLLVGKAVNTVITDCYTLGSLTSDSDFAGGLIGAADGVTASRCYSLATVTETNAAYMAGGLVGGLTGAANIQSALSFGGGTRVRAIDGNTDLALVAQSYSDCYEYTESSAESLYALLEAQASGQSGVRQMSNDTVKTAAFYTTLGFLETVWNMSDTAHLQLPVLQSALDTNLPELGDKNQINSLRGLIKISEDLAGTYTLGADIDLSEYTGSAPIVPGVFTGTLDGNGHKLYNGTAPLFEEVRGDVKNLRLEDFDIAIQTNDAGALAKTLYGAQVSCIEMNRIQIRVVGSGEWDVGANLGALAGHVKDFKLAQVNRPTRLSQISAKQVTVDGAIQNAGGLLGIINGGKLEHIYVEGAVSARFPLSQAGGLAANMTNTDAAYVFLDVDVEVTMPEYDVYAGGFAAGASGNFSNCVSLGNVINGSTFINNIMRNETVTTDFCYTLEGITGSANAEGVAVSTVTNDRLHEANFFGFWNSRVWDTGNVATDGRPTMNFPWSTGG